MPVIGTFSRSRDGGWEGSIKTLSGAARARFIPNDSKENAAAPDFRVVSGYSELGAAWSRRTATADPREYLSVQLDDPGWANAISAALFPADGGQTAQLVWNRRP